MASSTQNIKKAITKQWSDNYSSTPTEYQNLKFSGDLTQPFASLSIIFGKSFTRIKGSGTDTRHTGLIRVAIRVPLLVGTNRAYELADIAASILERKRFGTVTTRQASLHSIEDADEYFIVVVSVPFLDS